MMRGSTPALAAERMRARGFLPWRSPHEREPILSLALHVPALGDVLSRLAHRIRVVELGELGVEEAPAERRVLELARAAIPGRRGLRHHVRCPRHRLDPPADEHVAVPDRDRVRRGVHRLEARPAQPVDREPADLDRQSGEEQRHPRDVAIVLAGLVGAAEDHVLDESRVDAALVEDAADCRGGQVVGADGSERAAVAPDRRPDGRDDPRFAEGPAEITRHGLSLRPPPRAIIGR
jgi:hypothetical protein